MPDSVLLSHLLPDLPRLCLEETASTNADARTWLLKGAPHGSYVIADRQYAGRGRMGRSFVSDEGGMYLSIILKTQLPAGQVTSLCAVAVRRAVLSLTGMALDIKWVNDLLLQGRKVCGILCEGIWEGSTLLGVVAGIGLNISQKAFPPELLSVASSLYPDGNAPIIKEHFAAEILRDVLTMLPQAPAHMQEYRAACITLGQSVEWAKDGITMHGTAESVDDSGALSIRTESGLITLSAGEVSLHRAN